MPRHKLVSDEEVLDALLPLMLQTGPDGLTFAAAAKASGLSAATLVQRYGNREDLVESVLMRAWDNLLTQTRTADDEEPLTPQGAISLLMRLMPGGAAEQNACDGLLLLREDIRNPKLRAKGALWGKILAQSLGRRVSKDEKAAASLGWQMAAVWQGAHTWWAFTRGEDADSAIQRALQDWVDMVERAGR